MSTTVLIVDDDPVQRRLAEAMVRRLGFEARVAENGEQGLSLLRAGEAVDVVLLDLVMPGGLDGLGVLAEMRRAGIDVPVIVQTSNGSIDAVVTAMRAGAVDFVVKPAGAERLQVSIKNALKVDQLEEEVRRMRRRASGALSFKDLTSRSPDMDRVIRLAERSARSNIPVLIEGESGVGKEVLARAIQGSGDRRGKPFVTVNCGAIPENLVESTLFGHEKGAFTGAVARRIGRFEEANGGTLLLDEISEMDVRLQSKLLRALQERVIDRVGGTAPVKVDIRVLATSNRNLVEEVRKGTFREDLYYRLNVVHLRLPALRERPADILELAAHFARKYAEVNGLPVRPLSAEAQGMVRANPWRGNVRELENTLHRAVLLASGSEIGADAILTPEGDSIAPVSAGPAERAARVAEAATRGLVGQTVAQVECDLILDTLDHCLGNRTHAAKILGISIRTLRNKLNEYVDAGLSVAEPGSVRAVAAYG